jgi:hypothetical protein
MNSLVGVPASLLISIAPWTQNFNSGVKIGSGIVVI